MNTGEPLSPVVPGDGKAAALFASFLLLFFICWNLYTC